ncbi:TauD-domain-containing protein [Atractiella rhizophila]|nr:TauD-domain-containing protein [Atractiella rhizophila]
MAPISVESKAPVHESFSAFGAQSAVTDGAFLNTADPETNASNYKYAHYLPVFDTSAEPLPPLEPFEFVDPGTRVSDPNNNPLSNLLGPNVKVTDLTPTIGSVIEGIQLSQLNDAQKDELAVLVARRKVVAFKEQDWADEKDLDKIKDYGRYYGRLHIHPTSGHPKGHPEFHLVYRDGKASFNFEQSNRVTSVTWHSDVTYELQPPGTSFFWILDQPPSGGDTVFVNMVEAYERLSPTFRELLHGLEAVHSGFEQAEFSRSGKRGGVVRREPVAHAHPIVRTHPVTGERALFVNPQFTRYIVGLKKEESDAILNFLYDHLSKGLDFQARVKWEPRMVSIWDNRITAHTAIFDFTKEHRRHASRLTPQAERPYFK